ncbi:MAG: class I SAM-dependent methyltransferase [Bacteroidota bacterium]
MNRIGDTWNSGNPYEYFMGRWSSLMAPEFLKWLNISPNLEWLDIGCGTGALSEAIVEHCNPLNISCIDPSEGFLEMAKERLSINGDYIVGNVSNMPIANERFDIIVSGLALNFFPNVSSALSEMKRVSKLNGTIAAYVWDYADRMDYLRYFWDAAYQIDSKSRELDEGIRFPICNSDNLKNTFQQAGLSDIESTFLDIDTIFKSFEDFWNPFLGGQGPAPSFLASLTKELQEELKVNIRNILPVESDGSIRLLGRAIAIQGKHK